jgi:hypothetical protein
VDATLASDGAAQLDWRADVVGVEAPQWRIRFHADSTRKQRLQQMLAAVLPGTQVTSIESGDLEDIEQPVTMRMRGKVPHFARLEGDGLTIPLGRREHMVRDYAPLTSRTLDVRTYAQWTEQDDWTVRLPPGARVRSPPIPAKGSSPYGTYDVEVEATAAALHVKTTVTFVRTRVAAKEYPAFRAWCEEVDRALGQRAVADMRGVGSGERGPASTREPR